MLTIAFVFPRKPVREIRLRTRTTSTFEIDVFFIFVFNNFEINTAE